MISKKATLIFGALAIMMVFLPGLVMGQGEIGGEDGGIGFPFWGPLVACDGEVCTDLCQLLDLGQRVVFFGLTLLVIIIAPAMFAYGAFLMITSGGSEQRVTSGRKVITSAAIGLAIALLAFVIVATFLWLIGNRGEGEERVSWPNIQCALPDSPYDFEVPQGNLNPVDDQGAGGGVPDGGQITCATCDNFGGGDIIFKPGVGTQAAEKMRDAIYCFDNTTSFQIRVTEAYPPTYQGHQSPQHYNGCAIDFTVENFTALLFFQFIKPQAESCGLVVVNEYDDPSPQATGNHIHMHLPPEDCP